MTFFNIFLLFILVSCSITKRLNDSKNTINQSLDLISEKTVNYGPSSKIGTEFEDKTKEYGLDGIEAANFNLVDLNRDGHTDIVLIEDYIRAPKFYVFNPKNKKFEKLKYSPIDKNVKASHMYFYDFNKDGILDVLVAVLNQKSELKEKVLTFFDGFLENGKIFFKKSNIKLPKISTYSATVSLIDFDLDGDLDLFIGNWFSYLDNKPITEADRLFEFRKNEYIDVTSKLTGESQKVYDSKAFAVATPTFSSSVCDINLDGYPDILTTSTNGHMNKLWINQFKVMKGERYFKDYGVSSFYAGDTEGNLTLTGGGRTFSSICADYNFDGLMDVFLGELHHNYDSEMLDKSSILTGSSLGLVPKFIRTEYFLDNDDVEWHQSDRRGIWFDYNNDGLLDLLVDNTGYPPHTRLILFKQLSDHSFINVAKNSGIDFVNPQSTVIGDFNHDGFLDILSAQTNLRDNSIKKRIYLFENKVITNKNKSIRLFLRGQNANAHGLGAMVLLKVKKDGEFITKRLFTEYSYGGLAPQNEDGIHFALNESEQLHSIKVRWPFTQKNNSSPSSLEKKYEIKFNLGYKNNLTLCESGEIFLRKTQCN